MFEPLLNLMEAGGDVLWILLFVSFVLLALLTERAVFYKFEFMGLLNSRLKAWKERKAPNQREVDSIFQRQYEVSLLKERLRKRISLIEVITFMCPLFGLLGTVTGMIAVFDVMAFKGLGNPRLMAGGVSQATLPTMVSMVIALIGLIGLNYLKNTRIKLEQEIVDSFEMGMAAKIKKEGVS